MDKAKKKIVTRRIAWFFLRLFTAINGILPLRASYALGGCLGALAALAVRRHRRIALESLAIAFPRASLKERKKIVHDFFVFLAQSSFELFFYLKNTDKLGNVRIQGREHLEAALAKKKGVILVTAHLGNFPLMSLKLAKEGFPVNFITRPMRDEKAGDYLYKLRSNAGIKSIFSYPRRECVIGTINALRNNEIVILQMDQNFGTGGVWVNFFGVLAATPVGPVTLALRTEAAVIPAYIYRESRGKHCIKILPQAQLIERADKDETVLLNVIMLTRIIEDWIKHVPAQWSWIHRRWKSRPSKDVLSTKYKVEAVGPQDVA